MDGEDKEVAHTTNRTIAVSVRKAARRGRIPSYYEFATDRIIACILRLLTRQGHLVEEEGLTYVANAHGILDPENMLAPLQAASCTYRIAFGTSRLRFSSCENNF